MQEEQTRRRVLLLATGRWMSTARLALALKSLGCEVGIMAQRRHPAVATGIVASRYAYKSLRPVQSVLEAVRGFRPDAVIPADELAVLHVEELRAAAEEAEGDEQRGLIAMLDRSGIRPELMRVGRSRIALMQLAQREGVPTPDTEPVNDEPDLAGAVARLGLPLVLKADATFGGRGVKVVESLGEARASWLKLHRAPTMLDAARRGVVWHEWTHIRPWARGETRAVAAQRLVHGHERTAMAMTHNGALLAFVCLEVVQASAVRGPSSVVRVIEDAAMERAMRRVASALGLSGFCGFDFMVDQASGTPLLLEMNQRPTQLVHLPLGAERDLVAAYMRGVLGMEVSDREPATRGDLIALFPQELQRDPQSRALGEAYHDVPWDAPELVRWAIKPVPKVLMEDPRWKQ